MLEMLSDNVGSHVTTGEVTPEFCVVNMLDYSFME
jgi:hypothetical protein